MKTEEEIEELWKRLKEAMIQRNISEKGNRVVYCLECDEYAIEYIDHETDEAYCIDCEFDHMKHHLVSDWEETSLDGAIEVLKVILEKDND